MALHLLKKRETLMQPLGAALADAARELRLGAGVPQVDVLELRAAVDEMHVRVVEAGNEPPPLSVNGGRGRSAPPLDVVVGADDTERHKPDPQPLQHALEQLGADRDDAVYVGDSPFDIRAAKGAGMHSIAVTWGRIHPRERLEAEAPDAVVDTAEELLAAL